MLRFFVILGIIIAISFFYVRYLENSSIFFPEKDLGASPRDFNLRYEEVVFTTSDGIKIYGWFLPYSGSEDVLLFFHGNGGNISHRLDKIALLLEQHLNVFIIDYRGYGKSGGKPSEEGIYMDAEAAYNYLLDKKNFNPDDVIVYGESLGSAVAVDLASRRKVKALILEGGFSCGKDMGKIMFPYLPSFMIPDKFNSLDKIKEIEKPKLFIHSQSDEVVPLEFAKKLFNAASGPKYFCCTEGSHNGFFLESGDSYLSAIKDFLKSIRRG
ncbi:MAG: alpha/beta fold hydrolase [Candidatus Omnitrophica bacterium]|nr:alpha/beta fold hydrolase [Candidatus Omnitrophota bacterium]